MRTLYRHALGFVFLATLAGCAADPTAPAAAPAPAARPSLLLTAGEGMRILAEYVDAAGNRVMVAEYAAGTYVLADGTGGSVASVTIKTVIPPLVAGSTSAPCITSTIQKVETIAGWTYAIKKSGGCDKEIVVGLDNASTGQRAQFSFLMIFGKTKIDHGLVRD